MKLVNRGYLIVKPTEKFKNWANATNSELLLSDVTSEASCYLIEEEFWDDDVLIEKYFKKICKQEFFPVSQDAESWPSIENTGDFLEYFTTEIGSFVYDLLTKDLTRENA
ncbi:MAG: hypothetical protein FJX99_03595 [Bacteroidetes bacterium]|nr:hypothetical protein [Bacteroidota bacterium]